MDSVDALSEDLRRYLAGRSVLGAATDDPVSRGKICPPQSRRCGSFRIDCTCAGGESRLCRLASASSAAGGPSRAAHADISLQAFLFGQRQLYGQADCVRAGLPGAWGKDFASLHYGPGDLRAAQMSLAESMFENGDMKNAQKVFTQIIASAKASGDVESEAEAEATFRSHCL